MNPGVVKPTKEATSGLEIYQKEPTVMNPHWTLHEANYSKTLLNFVECFSHLNFILPAVRIIIGHCMKLIDLMGKKTEIL